MGDAVEIPALVPGALETLRPAFVVQMPTAQSKRPGLRRFRR